MRRTLDIPDDLLEDAQKLSGLKTKKEVVVAALEHFVRRRRIDRLRARIGKGNFNLTYDDLREMRRDREPIPPEADAEVVEVTGSGVEDRT